MAMKNFIMSKALRCLSANERNPRFGTRLKETQNRSGLATRIALAPRQSRSAVGVSAPPLKFFFVN
jgi:hypothetical protein